MVITIKGVGIMERKESFIPEKAHEVMQNFKAAPYGEVAKRLEAASDKTIAQYKKWEIEKNTQMHSGGDTK